MFVYVVAVLLFITFKDGYSSSVTVTLNDGKIEGHILKTINGREILAFEGVPYAEPPIADLRFAPPEPKKSWSDTWKANTLYTCLQYHHGIAGAVSIKGTEDCLYLNIYKPNEDLNDLDVIVYIHGGAFMFNSGGLYKPIYLMDKDVILVTINYRLGPLGFLSFEDEFLPGNNGLKDQTLALKWVKSNVHHFGGNPDSITIAGMSAGGASVHLHTLSPLSKGLFHKVYAQSGVALNPWVLTENAKEKAAKLSSLIGCTHKTTVDKLKCLRTRNSVQIVEAVKHFMVFLYNPFTPFGPVIERNGKDPFLPEHPLVLMQKKQVVDVPVLFTFVSCEGLYPGADFVSDIKHLRTIDEKWNDLIPYILHYNDTVSKADLQEVNRKVREFYFQDNRVEMETYDTLIRMLSDRLFFKDIRDAILIQSNSIISSVYSYKFNHVGVHGLAGQRAPGVKFNCTSHGDDLFAVIPPIDFMRTTQLDADISDILINVWTSFAKRGYPLVEDIPWNPVSKESGVLEYLDINSPSNIKMKKDEHFGNVDFWNSLPGRENGRLLRQKDEL